MQAETVAALYTLLLAHGVQLWIDGGWGIDALLQQQTRPHKDLDALAQLDDLPMLTNVLAEQGFVLKEIWEENRWLAYAQQLPLVGRASPAGSEVATAFVLRNGKGHELDFHLLTLDEQGNGIALWDADFVYPPDAFTGRGVIANTPVRCLSPRMQMMTHTGYPLQEKDRQDLHYLHERFGIAYLAEQAEHFATGQ